MDHLIGCRLVATKLLPEPLLQEGKLRWKVNENTVINSLGPSDAIMSVI